MKAHYIEFRSQSITESPPAVLAMMWSTGQVRIWWFTFISSQLNKAVRGRGEWLTEREKAKFKLPLTAQPVECVNISLCEPRTQGEMVSVGCIEAGLLKVMFFESAWHSIVHDPLGLCKMSPPAMLNFIFLSVFFFVPQRIFLSVCVAFFKPVIQSFLFLFVCFKDNVKAEEENIFTGKKLCICVSRFPEINVKVS